MSVSHDLLLATHFFGLFLGGASGVGLPVIGALYGGASETERSGLKRAVKPLKMAGHSGVALLLVTGFLLASITGAWSGAGLWFWIKLAGVLALIAGIVLVGKAGKKAMEGDQAAAGQAKTLSMFNMASVIIILVSAALAFH